MKSMQELHNLLIKNQLSANDCARISGKPVAVIKKILGGKSTNERFFKLCESIKFHLKQKERHNV